MQVAIVADRAAFDRALAAASKVNAGQAITGLKAPLDGATQGRVEAAWDAVRHALDRAFELGADYARSALDEAWQTVDKILQGAGHKAGEISAMVRARLRTYLTDYIDEMLKQVRAVISVGESTLSLTQVQLSQKLVLGGSLKASLTEAFELTSDGELQITASYAVNGARQA